MSIKVLHVNYSDNKGGAAIAVERICKAQQKLDINFKIITAEKYSNNKNVIGPNSTIEEIKWKILSSINRKINNLENKKKYDSNSYNLIPNNFVKKINKIQCDIVNLHWIGGNLIPIKDLKKINKPIVWTLHDMWAYTGSEHYTQSLRFAEGYNKNNKPIDSKGYDLEKYCWNLKKKFYPSNLKIIVTSDWQFNNAKKSILLKDKELYKIPLPLDFNFWKPIEKSKSREILNLPENKKIILIGSDRVDLERKGYLLLEKILNDLDKTNKMLIIFGRNGNYLKEIKNIDKVFLDEISQNSIDLKTLYSASDLFLAPSIQESFGQTVFGASSCCLPTVCFSNNGISAIVDHKKNGYIAKESDSHDFNVGIEWCLENIGQEKMKLNLNSLKEKFSNEIVGKLYKEVYSKII